MAKTDHACLTSLMAVVVCCSSHVDASDQVIRGSEFYGNQPSPATSRPPLPGLSLRLGWFSQFDNRELPSSSVAVGRTIFGLRAPATLRYHIDLDEGQAFALEVGGVIGHDFGDTAGDASEAILRAELQLGPHWLTIGTLRSDHALVGPLRSSQRVWQRGLEQGLQWRLTDGPWRLDSWLDWEQRERRQQQESFTAGHSGRWTSDAGLKVQWQALWWHQGGQRTTITGVSHNHSGVLGLRLPLGERWQAGLDGAASRDEAAQGSATDWGYGGRVSLRWRHRDGPHRWLLGGHAWWSDNWIARTSAKPYRAEQYVRISAAYRRQLVPGLTLAATLRLKMVDNDIGGSVLLGLSWHQQHPISWPLADQD